MAATNRYLGHVTIDPPLSQAEHDHLRAVSRGQVRLVGPDDLEPWCPWEPCAHGCCLRWDGSDCYGTGAEGLQLLVDRLLSSDQPLDSFHDAGLTGCTSDHDTNGVIAGETDDRALFLVRVEHGKVRTETILPGDSSLWGSAPQRQRELPWLSPEPSADERNRQHNEATLAVMRAAAAARRG